MAKLIGLDIGTTTIKLVELEQTGKTARLLAVGLSPTPAKGLMSEASRDQLALSDVVKKTAGDAKVSTKDLNLSLAENLVFSRIIQMPLLSEKELASAIRWEAEQYIPLPLSEVILDHQVMNKEVQTKTGMAMDVFLVGAPKNIVAKYQKIVEGAGFNLVSIETEGLALVRCLVDPSPASPVTMIVSMGASRATIIITKGATLNLTHVIPSGGEALTRALANDLGLEYAQAEEYKKTYGLKKEVLSGKVGNTVKPILDNLLSEIKRTIAFYESRAQPTEPIKSVMLVGGGAKLPGFVVYLTENLGVETQIGDPWQKVSDAQKLTTQPFDPVLFSEAVGLALKPR